MREVGLCGHNGRAHTPRKLVSASVSVEPAVSVPLPGFHLPSRSANFPVGTIVYYYAALCSCALLFPLPLLRAPLSLPLSMLTGPPVRRRTPPQAFSGGASPGLRPLYCPSSHAQKSRVEGAAIACSQPSFMNQRPCLRSKTTSPWICTAEPIITDLSQPFSPCLSSGQGIESGGKQCSTCDVWSRCCHSFHFRVSTFSAAGGLAAPNLRMGHDRATARWGSTTNLVRVSLV
mmetsp:Transcript_24541/g.79232  ORF Transcript_24541/g.79232 Transcript_24541/m.79232 type:complete len:232 (-) Transcript_24541:2186-2881(-)